MILSIIGSKTADIMIDDRVKQEAVFIGANKQSFVADYSTTEQLVAYGACNNVALWKPLSKDNKGVFGTLKKHTKEVTCVKFIPNSPYLLSTGEDFEVNIWKQQGSGYSHHQCLEFHQHSITCVSVINEHIFATGSADGHIALWGMDKKVGEWKLINDFEVKSGFYPMTLALQDIDEQGSYILAVGGTNCNIYIYSFILSSDNTEASHFSQSVALAGHEDWIKCLQFVTEDKQNYILASGSQDRYIRLWRLKLNSLIDDSDEDEQKLVLLSNKQYKFDIGTLNRAAFNFEALIMGHDDWVTGLQWHPSYQQSSGEKKLQLLSSSADTALMVWEMDIDSGIWCCVNRLGEMSIKGASTATGASGGFWSCLWFKDEKNKQYILANGKTGSFRMYKTSDEDEKKWESVLGVTGPVKEVTDLVWSKNGDYFSVTSLDQTTRLYAPWIKNREYKTWHEFARPQIHGYDMICLDNISSTKFVSGGDEKLLRVFEMTHSISNLLHNCCGIDIISDDNQGELPESASLPVLGLSNKAANEQLEAGEMSQQQQDIEENNEGNASKDDILETLQTPPLEDHLQRYTLFPELEKLYGHGYEITCCATSPSGSLIASACRSNSARHAVIRVFNVAENYQQCSQVLEGHNLTITSLEFSSDGKYLMSVSRDRQFSLWKVGDEKSGKFELLELNPKPHTRIIWDCSWVPTNSYGNFVVTASRDKQIKLWQVNDGVQSIASVKLQDAVTSVSCYKSGLLDNKVCIAVGLENGDISLFSVDLRDQEKTFKLQAQLDSTLTPSNRVAKLSFSSKLHDNDNNLMLGVASNDTSVRVYSINKDIFV